MNAAAFGVQVFVVGSPRSGTTWLHHLLLSSGGGARYHAEANVFNLLAPRFGDLSVGRHRDALLDAWTRSEFFTRSGLEAQPCGAEVHARSPGPCSCTGIGTFIAHELDYARICANGVGAVARPNTSFPVSPGEDVNPVGRWRRLDGQGLARVRRRASFRFTGRHFLKTRTPLGRVLTNPALPTDFHAFDRSRRMPTQGDRKT